ncbi:TPA: hypothetical protein U1383_000313 [Streptococcus suis]|nr:hypothetical protein [Streptococcus suis]
MPFPTAKQRKGLKPTHLVSDLFLSSLFKHKLVVVEFGVEAVELEELAVVALLNHFSILEEDD